MAMEMHDLYSPPMRPVDEARGAEAQLFGKKVFLRFTEPKNPKQAAGFDVPPRPNARNQKKHRSLLGFSHPEDNITPLLAVFTPMALIILISVVAKFMNLAALRDSSRWVAEVQARGLQFDLHTPVAFVLVAFGCFLFLQRYGSAIFPEATPAAKQPRKTNAAAFKTAGPPPPPLHARIRGVWYDLANFEHPGGPVALSLAKDRDATALFESHHYLIDHAKLMVILNKYKVKDEALQKELKTMSPKDDGGHYVWDK
jgi:hypothetical protein